jgi:hypothetical protein
VHHEHDAVADAERREQRIEILPVLDESIASRPAAVELLGVAHADQVGRDAPAAGGEVRDHVPPEVGRRRVAVQEDDRVALADLDVGHAPAADADALLGMALVGRDHEAGLAACRCCGNGLPLPAGLR